MNVLQVLIGTSGETLSYALETQGEIISVLAELGVINLLFEIGLVFIHSDDDRLGWGYSLASLVRASSTVNNHGTAACAVLRCASQRPTA